MPHPDQVIGFLNLEFSGLDQAIILDSLSDGAIERQDLLSVQNCARRQ